MNSHPASAYGAIRTALEPLVSLDDAAELLGVSRRTVLRALKAGELRPVRIGRRTLLEPSELRSYLERRREPI